MNQQRSERIASEISRILTDVLYREIEDPRIPSLIAITEVRMNRDGSLASVYVSTMGDDTEKAEMLEGLHQAKGYLRSQVAESLNLRLAPDLRFFLDDSLERGNQMEALIEKVRAEDKARDERLKGQSLHEDGEDA